MEIQYVFDSLSKTGNVSACRQLLQQHPIITIDKEIIQNLFRNSASSGKLAMCKWLATQYPNANLTKDTVVYPAFYSACSHGHLGVAKYLHEYANLDVHANRDYAFRRACECGKLHVVKWLAQTSNTINIIASNNNAFTAACQNGHIHVIKWLVSQYPKINFISSHHHFRHCSCVYIHWNMRDVHDQVLYEACESNNFKMVEFLVQTFPKICKRFEFYNVGDLFTISTDIMMLLIEKNPGVDLSIIVNKCLHKKFKNHTDILSSIVRLYPVDNLNIDRAYRSDFDNLVGVHRSQMKSAARA